LLDELLRLEVLRLEVLSRREYGDALVSRQKRLNYLLLQMIVKDTQPSSIVTDEEFCKFVVS